MIGDIQVQETMEVANCTQSVLLQKSVSKKMGKRPGRPARRLALKYRSIWDRFFKTRFRPLFVSLATQREAVLGEELRVLIGAFPTTPTPHVAQPTPRITSNRGLEE